MGGQEEKVGVLMSYGLLLGFLLVGPRYTRCSQQKMSQFFSDFTGNLCAWKPNKAETKQVNKIWHTVFSNIFARINRCQLCIYHLYSLYFTYPLFAPTSLFVSVSATDIMHRPTVPGRHSKEWERLSPDRWQGPCCNWASPPTTALLETHL